MERDFIRSISMPKWLMRNRSRRRSCSARRARSSGVMPATAAAHNIAPMLVPAYNDGLMPRSSSALRTPICAKPFIPPPPSTRATFRWLVIPPLRCSDGEGSAMVGWLWLLEILIQADQPDHRACDHHERAGGIANERARDERRAADDHHRDGLAHVLALRGRR